MLVLEETEGSDLSLWTKEGVCSKSLVNNYCQLRCLVLGDIDISLEYIKVSLCWC